MKIWFKLLSASALISISSINFASSINIIGSYKCTGNDPTASPSAYTNFMDISKSGDAYVIIEKNLNGSVTPWVQFGILTGDTLSIAYQGTNSKQFGVQVLHVIKQGAQLAGPFIYFNQFNLQGTEICKKVG